MKKIKKIILIIIVGIISFFNLEVNVNAYSNSDTFSSRVLDGFYIKKLHSDGTGKYKSISMITRNSDGRFVYCVQPWVELGENMDIYSANSNNQHEILGVTSDTWRKISLIAYYGYGYENHTDERWYGITQLMIWQEVDPDGSFFYTYTANGDRDYRYDWMKSEIEELISNHYIIPNFNLANLTLNIGETITITDANNVLDGFDINSNNNIFATKNGNTITLTATNVGNTRLTLTKSLSNAGTDNTTILYNYLDRQKIMSRGYLDPVSLVLNINVVGGRIKLTKHDSKNHSVVAQGEATLVGAKYGIYNSNGELVETLTIGNDSTAITGYLSPDTYYVKEISPSRGYKLDDSIYTIVISSSSTYDVVVNEDVIENDISILKQYDYVNGNTTFLHAESGIIFDIYDITDNLYKTITTDKNGYAEITLPYGNYRFSQQNSHLGFEKIEDFYVTVNENTEQMQYYNILNNKLAAYLKVLKVDAETGNQIAIANTVFRILNLDTNEYVVQHVGGKNYDIFKTDEDGQFITPLKLEYGNYKLVEIESPKGYLLDGEGINFSIDENSNFADTEYGYMVIVVYNNRPIKGIIELKKIGEVLTIVDGTYNYEKKQPLENIKFYVYAYDDIKTPDNRYIYYSRNELVDTIITDENGRGISKQLPLGKYRVVEVATINDYVLDTFEYIIELKEIDNITSIVSEKLELVNYLKKGKLEFNKVDLVTGEAIPNTKIEIYTIEDLLIYSGITDENGKIIIKDLPLGKFYIVEKEAKTGYSLSDEKVYFEIKENNEIISAIMTNEKVVVAIPNTEKNSRSINKVVYVITFMISLGLIYYGTKKINK